MRLITFQVSTERKAGPGLLVATTKGNDMQHVRATIEGLRRYIADCEAHAELEEVDTLLAVALEEVRRKLQQKATRDRIKRN